MSVKRNPSRLFKVLPIYLVVAINGTSVYGELLKIGPPHFSVRLAIAAQGDFQNYLTSCVSRELRSLGDVEIVEGDNPDYLISLVGLENKNAYGIQGYTVSVFVGGGGNADIIRRSIDRNVIGKNLRSAMKETVKNTWSIADHEVRTFPVDLLDSSCKQLIADFDSGILEDTRKSIRKYNASLENK